MSKPVFSCIWLESRRELLWEKEIENTRIQLKKNPESWQVLRAVNFHILCVLCITYCMLGGVGNDLCKLSVILDFAITETLEN